MVAVGLVAGRVLASRAVEAADRPIVFCWTILGRQRESALQGWLRGTLFSARDERCRVLKIERKRCCRSRSNPCGLPGYRVIPRPESGAPCGHAARQRAFGTVTPWRGRQLVQLGDLAEAAAVLEDRFSVAEARHIVGPGVASNVVALGKLKIHTGEDKGAHDIAEIAKVMLQASAPGVQRHPPWFLALYSMSWEIPLQRIGLFAFGETATLAALQRYPMEAEDAPQLVRIGIASGDDELARAAVALARRDRSATR